MLDHKTSECGPVANRDLPIARAALEAYGLRGRLRCVATGLDTTFRVAADGRQYALKVGGMNPERPAQMLVEASWMRALGRGSEVWVPEVVLCGDGPMAVVDDRGCYLVEWLPGRSWRWRPTVEKTSALGHLAAQLHDHARRFELPPGAAPKQLTPRWMSGRWREGGDPLGEVAGFDGGALHGEVEERLTKVVTGIDPAAQGIVNGDLGPHNVLWHDGRVGIYDFNDAGWGWFAFDLARLVGGFRWRPHGDALVGALLDGYCSAAPLPDGYEQHGPLFEAAAKLQLARYVAGRFLRRGAPDDAEVARRLGAEVIAALS